MKYWTDQLQKGDVIEYRGHRRKVRSVMRQGEHVHSIVIAKKSASKYDSVTTRVNTRQLRSESDYGIVDTDADLTETYLEEQIQRVVEGEPPRPPTQDDLNQNNPIY